MNGKDLTREQIMKQASKEGISISIHMLEKYVNWGLLVHTRHSLGGRTGTKASTYASAMENLRMIHKYRAAPYRCNTRDIIFLLYWKGLPVSHRRLMQHLRKFHETIAMPYWEDVKGYTPKVIRAKHLDRVRDEVTPVYTAAQRGNLTNEDRADLEQSIEHRLATVTFLDELAVHLLTNSGVTLAILAFLDPHAEHPEFQKEDLRRDIATFVRHPLFRTERWIRTPAFRRHNDARSTELLEQWQHWSSTYLSELPPLQGKARQTIDRLWNAPWRDGNVELQRLALYLLLASDRLSSLVAWLSDPDRREQWANFLSRAPKSPLFSPSSVSLSPSIHTAGGEDHG